MATDRLEFTLTESNLHEGGRRRRGEAYLNLTTAQAVAIGDGPIRCMTPDHYTLTLRATGATAWNNVKPGQAPAPKNLRSLPGMRLGEWLAQRKAKPDDKVYAYGPLEPANPRTPALWFLRHEAVDLKAEAMKTPEAFSWDEVFAKRDAAAGPPAPEGAFYRGRGIKR